MKPCFIFGTRPEAIKLAPLIEEFQKKKTSPFVVCVTGQHRSILDQMLQIFDIHPDFDLNLMWEDQDLLDLGSRSLAALKKLLDDVRPSLVIVQGDTTSALMAAIASSYRRIPVAHVEAGLRTHDLANPFPEEMNRTLVDRLSQWHFAPTEGAKENLLSEGLSSPGIFVTGNTVVDSLVRFRALLETPEKRRQWTAFFQHELELPLQAERRSPLVLVTCHRRESFGPDLEAIVQALKRLVKEEREIHLVLPIHPNPHVRGPVREALEGIDRLHLTEPLSYEPFLFLLTQSQLILTDSGGVQEEAPSLGVPTLVMRKKTERPELIQAGWGELVGTSTDSIVETARRWLHAKERPSQPNPFGDGHAAPRIAEILKRVCQT